MSRKEHWERMYQTKGPTELSWFQPEPTASLRLLDAVGLDLAS
jgi:hypothetical protein